MVDTIDNKDKNDNHAHVYENKYGMSGAYKECEICHNIYIIPFSEYHYK